MSAALTPELIVYGLESVGDPQISPDGNGLLFTRSKAERGKKLPGSQIWLSQRNGSDARQLTRVGERNSGGRWAADGQSIAFVSDRVKKTGLFVMPFGGESIEITRHNGPISELAWSPDGKTIAYTALFDPANPDESDPGEQDAPRIRVTARIDYKQDSRGYLDNLRPHVWLVDVESGTRRRLTSDAVDHGNPAWSPDGTKIAVRIGNHNGLHSQLGVIEVETGEVTIVGPGEGVIGCWAWSPTGDRLLLAADMTQSWQLDLFVYDVDADVLERLTDDLTCLPDSGFPTVSPPSQPVWLDDNTAVLHALRAGSSGLYLVDVNSGSVEREVEWKAMGGAPSVGGSGKFVAQAQISLDAVSSIIVYNLELGATDVVVKTNQELPGPANWTTFQIERNGETIDAWLLRPHDDEWSEDRRYPLVLDIHGGPNSHYGFGFNAIQQALATSGIAVLYCNPRGSSSYGRAFTQAVSGDWAGEDYLDLMAVVDAAIANDDYQIDPERMGVYGYSYGGYMTSWIIGHNDRFKAAVIGAPVVDLVSFYGTSDIGHVFGPKQIGGTPWSNNAEYVKRSPLTNLHTVRIPSLIIHGEADDRCPIGQGEQCFVTLLENGCEVEFARYPGGAHTFLRTGFPAHREDVLKRVTGWFSQHLNKSAP